MDPKPSVYLAGPITHADDYGIKWREKLIEEHDQYEFRNPFEIVDVNEEDVERVPASVMDKDLEALHNSDAVLAKYPLTVPTGGTAVEIWEAGNHNSDIHVVVVIDAALDEYGPAVRNAADMFVPNIDEGIQHLDSFFDLS